jgi:Cu+-exporting ATPase
MVTGESLPVVKEPGQRVIGGCVNGAGAMKVRVTAVGAETVLAGIVNMVDQAQATKLPIQKTVDRVSAVFVPGVMVISGLTFAGWLAVGAGVGTAFSNAIAVLLIACPCALGLATPAAIMVGTGQAAKRGVFIRLAPERGDLRQDRHSHRGATARRRLHQSIHTQRPGAVGHRGQR